jgi:vacuolar-type H+-ATPase subunit F/Vma7
MARVMAIGDERLILGYALAGVEVVPARGREAVSAACEGLPDDVALVLLSPDAEAAARGPLAKRDGVIWCSLPA